MANNIESTSAQIPLAKISATDIKVADQRARGRFLLLASTPHAIGCDIATFHLEGVLRTEYPDILAETMKCAEAMKTEDTLVN